MFCFYADCRDLQQLVDNIDPNILGVCGVKTPCTEVGCVNSPLSILGDASITVLPCALPQPSLNLLALNENGAVLGNFTSYKDEADFLRMDAIAGIPMPVFRLDWIIQYNKADSSLTFQVS